MMMSALLPPLRTGKWRLAGCALLLACQAQAQTSSPVPQAKPATKPAVQTQAKPALVAPAPVQAIAPVTPASAPVTDPLAIRVLLTPELETVLASQMLGRIESINTSLGAHVSKNQVLMRFDCEEPKARLLMAKAEYENAKEAYNVKQRLRTLDAAGDSEVLLAQTMADKARAAVSLTQVQIDQCVVKAPFSGHVVKLHVKPAQGMNVGLPLLEMVSDGPLKLRLNVPSQWLPDLRKKTAFEVTIDETRKTYPAKITAINARVDAVAQTVELEGRIDGRPAELLAGMSGVARFPGLSQ